MTEFERRLKEQPWRELPPELRETILSPSKLTFMEEPARKWRDWLWPSPLVWGAMAAVWLIFLGAELLSPALEGTALAKSSGPSRSGGSDSGESQRAFPLSSTTDPLFAALR